MSVEQDGLENKEGKDSEFLVEMNEAVGFKDLQEIISKYDSDGETVLRSEWGVLTPKELGGIINRIEGGESVDIAPPEIKGICQKILDEKSA